MCLYVTIALIPIVAVVSFVFGVLSLAAALFGEIVRGPGLGPQEPSAQGFVVGCEGGCTDATSLVFAGSVSLLFSAALFLSLKRLTSKDVEVRRESKACDYGTV